VRKKGYTNTNILKHLFLNNIAPAYSVIHDSTSGRRCFPAKRRRTGHERWQVATRNRNTDERTFAFWLTSCQSTAS